MSIVYIPVIQILERRKPEGKIGSAILHNKNSNIRGKKKLYIKQERQKTLHQWLFPKSVCDVIPLSQVYTDTCIVYLLISLIEDRCKCRGEIEVKLKSENNTNTQVNINNTKS